MTMAHPNVTIRLAQPNDLARIVEIYNQSVVTKQATADLVPVSVADRQAWFDSHTGNRPIIVAESRDEQPLLGWASLSDLYARPAYHISSEISIYVDEAAKGQGVGKLLLTKLLEVAPSCGVQQIVALIFAHNLPSIGLFQQFGFEEWGLYRQVCDMDGFIADVAILGKSIKKGV